MPSSTTMPNDSPRSDGAHSDVRPQQAGIHLTVAEDAQPLDPVRLGMSAPLHLALRAVPGHPQDGRSLEHVEGVEEDAQALARSRGGPGTGRSGRSDGTGSASANRSMSTPLKSTSYSPLLERSAVSRAASETATRTCSRDPTRYTSGLSTRDPPAHAGAVIRPHHGHRGVTHEPVGGHGRQRLVQVQHVEATLAYEALGLHGRPG